MAKPRWEDNGQVFATQQGRPVDASHVRRAFKKLCQVAGIGSDWTPRESTPLLCEDGGMPGLRPNVRDFGFWLAGRWRRLLIMFLLAPVLGPGIALFCLAAGVRAISRSRSPRVAAQISLGETLDALAAAVLPAAIYGCTVWGLQVAYPSSRWVGWIIVSLVAGLVTLVAGFLPAIYIFGYSWGVAEAEAAPKLFRAASPPMSLGEQMLRPFRRRAP